MGKVGTASRQCLEGARWLPGCNGSRLCPKRGTPSTLKRCVKWKVLPHAEKNATVNDSECYEIFWRDFPSLTVKLSCALDKRRILYNTSTIPPLDVYSWCVFLTSCQFISCHAPTFFSCIVVIMNIMIVNPHFPSDVIPHLDNCVTN